MKPLARVRHALEYFARAKPDCHPVYGFTVPDGVTMRGHAQAIRAHALRLGLEWSVVHNKGRAWIIKQKGK